MGCASVKNADRKGVVIMKKSLVELGKLVKKDIEYEESFLECVKGSENTQVKEKADL